MTIDVATQKRRFHGKRYICQVRQSNDSQGTSSTDAQLQWMHDIGRQLGMVLADDVVLSGVTGSLPGKRQDIEELFRRKTSNDDFEVLMIQRVDRSTRGGVAHGMWFEHECARRGITVIYPGEDLPEDEHHAIWPKVVKFEAAYEQAKAISQRSTQGWLYAFGQGRCLPISRTPFGCDRLYLSADGQPQFRIRCFADGTQQKLDIDGHTVLETFAAKGHYRKQKDQKPILVPGATVEVDAVRMMFELHYGRNMGGKRIAGELNDRGIRSPKGLAWSQHQVESIYENPIYCGLALGGRSSQGIFNRRGRGVPEAIDISSSELACRIAAPRLLRPPEDWLWVEQPPMGDFLPEPIRAKALPLIKQLHVDRWRRSQDTDLPRHSTSKHKSSDYILTGLLVAKQDGEPLTGVLCGKVGKKVRKYRHRRGNREYRKGSIFNNYIRAAELESATLDLVLEIAADVPHLRQRIMDAMTRKDDPTQLDQQLKQTQQERDTLGQKFSRIMANMQPEDQLDLQSDLDLMRNRRRHLESRIATLTAQLRHIQADPGETADVVVARLQALPRSHVGLDAVTKRNLLQAFVERIEVDMASRDAEVFLRLPAWALETASRGNGEGRVANSSPSPTVDETHPLLSVRLASAGCQYVHDRSTGQVCYRCRRRAA